MARLTQGDVASLNACILAVNAHRDLATFPRHAVKALATVIPAEYYSYINFDANISMPQAPPVLEPSDISFPEGAQIFAHYSHEHPVIAHHRSTGDGAARKLSDFLSRRQLHRLDLYNEFYRRLGTEYQISITLPAAASQVIAVACNRSTRDFSERDRLCLNFLRSHLTQAHNTARAFTTMQHAVAAQGQASDGLEWPCAAPSLEKPLGLTRREAEVLFWIAHGCSALEVADLLTMRPRTVEKHLEHIFVKLGVNNRGTATYRALKAMGTWGTSSAVL